MNGFFIFLFLIISIFLKVTQDHARLNNYFARINVINMKHTLKTKKIKIWVTEVVCNLLMNNLTTHKFKQLNPL